MTQLTLPVCANETSRLVMEALYEWRTIAEVRDFVVKKGGPYMSETGTSARIRDLRKAEFGTLSVKTQPRRGRLYEYRLGEA